MNDCKLIGIKTVLDIYPVSRATLYRQIKVGLFPEPVQIGVRRVAWRMDQVLAHINGLQNVPLAD
jgi:prophage regulatory protein